MKTTRQFDGMTDRYAFDFNACSSSNGYAQIDTEQDASYYGTWANPFKLQIVSYAEGDITIQKADNDKEFADEIRAIADWNVEVGFKPIGIDPGFNKELKAGFVELGLSEYLH
jgi:hypothetical protein